jgi:lipopolysaccharide transport system permease protein
MNLTEPPSQPVTRIQPSRGWASLGLHDLLEYRELLGFLASREIKRRYRQMALGPLWLLLVPVANVLVFSLVSGMAGLSSAGLPRPVFILAGVLSWQMFAEATRKSSTSLVNSLDLISKVYFPRIIVPLANLFIGAIDFGVALLVLAAMLLIYGVMPTPAVALLALFVLLALASALVAGLWLGALAVRFRDVGYGIGYVLQVAFFLSPVFYSSSLVSERWRPLYMLNPMAHVIEGFRWTLGAEGYAPGMMLPVSAGLVLLLLVGGAYVFRRMERTVVDYL